MNLYKFLLLISLSTFSVLSWGRLPEYPNELRPFSTDGCSLSPDLSFVDCCKIHDLAYWQGGTAQQKERADKELQACVAERTLEPIGYVYYLGVIIGGSPEWGAGFRWGYGWKYLRRYEALSFEELEQVKTLTPPDVLAIPVSDTDTSPEAYPSKNGDYCQDEIEEYFNQKMKNSGRSDMVSLLDIRITESASTQNASSEIEYEVHVSYCSSPIIFNLGYASKEKCTKMRPLWHGVSFIKKIGKEDTCSF